VQEHRRRLVGKEAKEDDMQPTADATVRTNMSKGRKIPPAIHDRLSADRRAARAAYRAADTDTAWRLLEATHVLSQPWVRPHVRSHVDMLRLAVRTRDRREVLGQLLRVVVAGPGSATGRYPVGNTGRATVPATLPMPLPADLAELLAAAGR
jgi:hypothetical protein